MKLYIALPSPYSRKCRIVVREKGLTGRVEEIVVNPYENAPELLATNPVVQVPTLIAEDGLPLIDSPLICEYLDDRGQGARLCPTSGSERLAVRRFETLACATLEMGVKLVLEKRRPESERSPSWMERWTFNMGRGLDDLEAELASTGAATDADALDIGLITAGVAGTWISFRHPDYDWKTGRPHLVALCERLEQRPSFKATVPA